MLGGLHLTFIEYGVMRNDAQEDIDAVTPADVNRLEIAAKLSQFQVVLRYPATLLASRVFSPFLWRSRMPNPPQPTKL